MSARALVLAALVVSLALPGAYLAAGGGDYEPAPVGDPCADREWRDPEGLDEIGRQFALSALDGAACELGISRERLAAGLATAEGRERLAAELGIGDPELEAAVRAGVARAIGDAEAAGELDPLAADALAAIAANLPVDEAIALIQNGGEAIERVAGLAGDLGGLLEGAGDLLP